MPAVGVIKYSCCALVLSACDTYNAFVIFGYSVLRDGNPYCTLIFVYVFNS